MRYSTPFIALLSIASTVGLAAGETATPTPNSPPSIPVEAVKKVVDEHVQAKVREGRGVYRIRDEVTGEELELVFEHTGIVGAGTIWSVHDRFRTAARDDFYACTMFHPVRRAPDRRYDLDFRVEPRAGGYVVREVVIHREGKLVDGKWVWTARRSPKPREVEKSTPM